MPFDNSRKTPLAYGLHDFADQKTDDAIQLLGKALPCHVTKIEGQLVTVAFDAKGPWTLPEVTMPISTNNTDWLPIQVGDRGNAVPGDLYLGGVSGQGGGTADFFKRSNLSTLWFSPVSNKAWTPPGDGNQDDRIISSPKGVLLVGKNGTAKLYVDDNGHIVITGDLRVSGAVIAGYGGSDQVTLQHHIHDGVMPGGGDTTEPIPGT